MGDKLITSRLKEIFNDEILVPQIQKKLPYLFKIADLECSRAGKIGMEVGSVRERILCSLLIYKFGNQNVRTDIPITQSEVDVELFGDPISIKTITGNGGVKLIWTVDAQKARQFCASYTPGCDILLAQIIWGNTGGLYFIPVDVQRKTLQQMKQSYFNLPKEGTNPRGVEFSKEALLKLMRNQDTKVMPVYWKSVGVTYDSHQRWVFEWGKT